MGDGTARSGRLLCKQNIRWVRIPYLPPLFARMLELVDMSDLGSDASA